MSEHMSITGPCSFQHSPEDEEGGFAFCHRCKKIKQKLTIELHQGICNDYIQCVCPHCDKTIWVAELTNSYDDEDEYMKLPKKWKKVRDNGRVIVKDDKKCYICKKSTNTFDVVCYTYIGKKDIFRGVCSEKCFEKWNLQDNEKSNNKKGNNKK